jgi:hypothetical protein
MIKRRWGNYPEKLSGKFEHGVAFIKRRGRSL